MEKILKGKTPYYLIVGLGIIIYFRSLFFGFTYFDDQVLVLDNLFFLRDLSNIFRTFTMEVFHILHASAAYYRPLLTISFMIDAQFSGANPFFYHLTNIVIHLATSCLVYLFFLKTKVRKDISFILALIFIAHPIMVQAVSWIPGRNDSLLALFLLPSFIFLIDYLEKRNFKYFWYHLLFFALSLFTKESAVLIPLMSLLYIFLFEKDKLLSKWAYALLAGWGSIGIAWFLLRQSALVNPIKYTPSYIIKTLIYNSPAILLYIEKIFLPIRLSVLPTLQDSGVYLGIVVLLILIILVAFSKKRNNKKIIFGFIWFVVFLLPSFIRPSIEYVPDFLEHRAYVPLVGLLLIVSEIDFVKKINLKKREFVWGIVILILLLSLITIYHSGKFTDKLTYWKNAVEDAPSHPLSHKNLGAMLYLEGNLDNAEIEFLRAVELSPTEPMIHNNLGLIYMNRGEFDRAEEEYKKELELYPYYDNAHFNWGLLYYQKDEKEKAVEKWLQTYEINPDHMGAIQNLALYYKEVEDVERANYFYQEYLRRVPQ